MYFFIIKSIIVDLLGIVLTLVACDYCGIKELLYRKDQSWYCSNFLVLMTVSSAKIGENLTPVKMMRLSLK